MIIKIFHNYIYAQDILSNTKTKTQKQATFLSFPCILNKIYTNDINIQPYNNIQSHFWQYSFAKDMLPPQKYILLAFFMANSIYLATNKCVYKVLDDLTPQWIDEEPHLVKGLTQCTEYNGKLGCCNMNNDKGQQKSYIEIDGVFGSQGDACDLCAINLKRFWCEYACSPRQSDFMNASKQLTPFPDPLHPGETLMVQKISLRVHAKAACDLYSSCKRVAFVNSVSAMGTPAGFLNFQGHNAVTDAFQYIDVIFSNHNNDSLWFDDSKIDTEPQRSTLQSCNYTTTNKTIHGFPFYKNCTCNNCQDSCDSNGGFVYKQPSIFEDFNWPIVVGSWGGALLIAGAITYWRKRREDKEKEI